MGSLLFIGDMTTDRNSMMNAKVYMQKCIFSVVKCYRTDFTVQIDNDVQIDPKHTAK